MCAFKYTGDKEFAFKGPNFVDIFIYEILQCIYNLSKSTEKHKSPFSEALYGGLPILLMDKKKIILL